MSLEGIFEEAYISPRVYLIKHSENIDNIDLLIDRFSNQNLIFKGEAGIGKTMTFLHLYCDYANKDENVNLFYYLWLNHKFYVMADS